MLKEGFIVYLQAKTETNYRIFSVECPRRLFETWPGERPSILPLHLKFIIPQINV